MANAVVEMQNDMRQKVEERTKERQGFEATREHLDAELEDRVNAALHANRQLSICWRSWAGTADKRKAAMKALRRGAAFIANRGLALAWRAPRLSPPGCSGGMAWCAPGDWEPTA